LLSHPILNAGMALLLALAANARGDDPAATADGPEDRPPTFILLDPKEGSAVGALLDRLRDPDFVLLDGRRYRELLDAARRAAEEPAESAEPAPESVAIRGELGGEVADLEVAYRFILDGDDPVTAPLRLGEGQVLTRVLDGDRDLAPRAVEGGWAVDLRGRGAHEVRVALRAPIRSVPDGQRLELAIPEAPETRLDLGLAGPVSEAKLDGRDPLEVRPTGEDGRSRIEASLTPRPLLELTWRAGTEGGDAGPALLTAHGDIAVDLEPGSLRISATYELRAERGEATSLGFRLEPTDELIGVELDGQPVATGVGASGEFVEVPMPRPLRPGAPRKLAIVARRHVPAGGPTRTVLRGFALRDVAVQAGFLAVAQSGALTVGGDAGQSLRRVDPRSELPPGLRVRASNVLAYQFFDQPFELGLRVDPSPPWVRVESRTTITLASRLARVDARLDYQVARGRVFEVRVGLPAGLRLDSAGPARWVDGSETLPEPDGGGGHVVTVTLSDAAREAGRFELHLTGRQDVDQDGRVEVGLFRPRDASTQGGQLAVLTARDVTAERVESDHFPDATTKVPAGWAWPDSAESSPSLWLLDDGQADALPLVAEVHPRLIRHRATLDAVIDRARVEVRQETLVRVDYGTISRLDVAVPARLDGRWEPEGVEITRREPLGAGEDGRRRYRLSLAREVSDQVRLRFRVSWDLASELGDRGATAIELEPIAVLDGEAEPTTFRVAADPGIRLEPKGAGWSADGEHDAGAARAREEAPPRLVREGIGSPDEPAVVLASAPSLASLPGVVASRLWFRTVREADGSAKGSASFRLEVHAGELAFRLPDGAEPRLVHVGDSVAREVERLPEASCFRLRFPDSAPSGPVTVRIEYDLPAAAGASAWEAPSLLRGGVVQWSFWEVRLPWRDVLVGVPEGWTDENRWAWDLALWSRRPRYTAADLAAWAGDPQVALDLSPTASASRSDSQAYLFSRPGEPGTPRPWVGSRAVLVAGCSGLALATGLVLLILRPPARLAGVAGAAAAILLAGAWHPSVVLLVAQSAALGLALSLLAWVMQRVVEHRGRGRAGGFAESGEVPAAAAIANGNGAIGSRSSQSRAAAPDEGPEGSTIIRPRPGSTAEVLAPSPSHAEVQGGGGP
jgi:hypothetical protein